MVTSGFHLWQFQVFNSGTEWLVVVLFWLDLWEIFFLATLWFELGTSGSLVLHSTTVPRQLLVFTTDNFRYLTLVQRDCCGIVLIGPVRDFLFGHTVVWTGDLWISSPALCHCAMVTSGFHLWQFQVFNSGAEGLGGGIVLIGPVRDFLFGHDWGLNWDLWISSPALYHCAMVTSGFHLWQFQVFNSGAEGLAVLLFWLDLWEIFFLATLGFELGTSESLVLHSTTVPWWLLVFTSDNFRYLTLVQRDWWWYCSDWTCERFSFWPHWGLNCGPLDLWSCTLPLCHGDFWFSPLTI